MSKQVQLRRGTASNVATFTGAEGELLVNTDDKRLVLQDGVTAGGVPVAKQADVQEVASQLAAKANQSTTYTKEEVDSNVGAVQAQVDALVVEGDSSVEAAQARVPASGDPFATLKARLDNSDGRLDAVASQLAENTTALGNLSFVVADDGGLDITYIYAGE